MTVKFDNITVAQASALKVMFEQMKSPTAPNWVSFYSGCNGYDPTLTFTFSDDATQVLIEKYADPKCAAWESDGLLFVDFYRVADKIEEDEFYTERSKELEEE